MRMEGAGFGTLLWGEMGLGLRAIGERCFVDFTAVWREGRSLNTYRWIGAPCKRRGRWMHLDGQVGRQGVWGDVRRL